MSLSFEVKGVDGQIRLDQYLKRQLADEGVSFRKLSARIKEKGVIVNGRLIKKKSWLVKNGDKIEIEWPLPKVSFSPLPADNVELKVLYEDEAIIVVHKDSGVPTYPLYPEETSTLANAIIAKYPMTIGIGYQPQQAGILYRLDVDTSGIVISCKTGSVFKALRKAMKSGQIKKEYIAMVFGRVDRPGRISYYIATKGRSAEKVIVLKNKNYNPAHYHSIQPALTYYQVYDIADSSTLLKVKITEGRRHQIRAHLASIGHPVVGDKLYCKYQMPDGLNRLFLHAFRVIFPHPLTGRQISIRDPLPKELQSFWDDVKSGKINIRKYMVEEGGEKKQ